MPFPSFPPCPRRMSTSRPCPKYSTEPCAERFFSFLFAPRTMASMAVFGRGLRTRPSAARPPWIALATARCSTTVYTAAQRMDVAGVQGWRGVVSSPRRLPVTHRMKAPGPASRSRRTRSMRELVTGTGSVRILLESLYEQESSRIYMTIVINAARLFCQQVKSACNYSSRRQRSSHPSACAHPPCSALQCLLPYIMCLPVFCAGSPRAPEFRAVAGEARRRRRHRAGVGQHRFVLPRNQSALAGNTVARRSSE